MWGGKRKGCRAGQAAVLGAVVGERRETGADWREVWELALRVSGEVLWPEKGTREQVRSLRLGRKGRA